MLPCAYRLNNWDEFSSTPSNGKAPRSIVLLGELKYQELMVAKSRVKVIGSFLLLFNIFHGELFSMSDKIRMCTGIDMIRVH